MTLTEREKELILAHLEETLSDCRASLKMREDFEKANPSWVQTSELKQMKTQAIAFIEELKALIKKVKAI